MNAEAQNEKENTSNLVLKGGISSCEYVWHSENSDTTCDECSDLDGQEFNFEDEVPERQHPNCKCTVEIVEYNDENEAPDEEPCDCLPQLAEWFSECDERNSVSVEEIQDNPHVRQRIYLPKF